MSNFDPIMKILLLPIAWIYHIILSIRHKLYDWHLLKSKRFEMPVIGVGNLALGGTGKTPHVEYLIDLLTASYRVCVVSRGYGRKTKGFQLANASCSAETVGDEPMQYVGKFNEVMVAVDENRNRAIELMETMDRPPEVYLLDDAFQHRATQAGLNILLTAYDLLYTEDYLIPAGTLRDVRSAAKRADLIVVSKAPCDLSDEQRKLAINKLHPIRRQKVFFSSLQYEPLEAVSDAADTLDAEEADTVLLFSGIARPQPLADQLRQQYHVEVMAFPDHHFYSKTDVEGILKRYQDMEGRKKIVVTTEKDYARIKNSPYFCQFESVPLYVAPINIHFHQQEEFNKEIIDYVREAHQHG